MKIFINSYTYAYERHLRMFDYFRNKKDLVFIVPKLWKAKGGKIRVVAPDKPEFKMIRTWSPFYHSHYPVIKGMLKGWMPLCGNILRKMAKPGDVLLSSAEPNLLTTYLYSRLAKKLGLKHVFLTWQNISYAKRLSGRKLAITEWLLRENIRLSSGALCGTKQALEILQPYLRPDIPTAIIPQSGVDTDIFKPGISSDFRKKYGLENKFIFLFGAVFDERKGVFTTIRAFHKTLKNIPSAHLVMIGIGKLWLPAQDLVKELGIIEKVTFIEWLPNQELPGILSSADVLVHPSEPYKDWEEQYGWMLLQASACGLPIIATNIGAISEAVIDKKTGILVEPKNVDALSVAMVQLAQNEPLRREFSKNAVEFIVANFSHKVIAERLEKFLYSL